MYDSKVICQCYKVHSYWESTFIETSFGCDTECLNNHGPTVLRLLAAKEVQPTVHSWAVIMIKTKDLITKIDFKSQLPTIKVDK